jgi:hypothetical protein
MLILKGKGKQGKDERRKGMQEGKSKEERR